MTASRRSDETLVILFLGMLAIICIGGIVVLEAFAGGNQSDALLTIGSLCVGALAGRISSQYLGANARSRESEESDAFEIIGRAATKKIIADALRNME